MTQFRRVRLDWLVTEARNTVAPELIHSDQIFHYSIPVLDETGDGRFEPTEDLGSSKTLLAGGEVLISKLNPRKARVHIAASHDVPTVCSGEFVVLHPLDVDRRYLYWVLMSETTRQTLDSRVQSVTRSQQRARPGDITKMWIEVPPQHAQRAIASYLDEETARIDALVAARSRMLTLVDERLDGLVTRALDRADWPMVPLKWTTRVTVGIVIRPSELYVESGVPCLRGFNVRPGVVTDADLAFISAEANAVNSKSTLSEGDVVVVRTGKAGATAIVPKWAVGGNCVDLLIARRTDSLDPRFLEAVLNSAVVRRQIEERSVGALQAHFNTESLASLRVPVPDRVQQRGALSAIDDARADADAMRAALARQIELLLERRQALITAAVTGQLEILGVAA